MNWDLSEYWSRLRKTKHGWLHPEDEGVLCHSVHSFNLDFPPPAFIGDVSQARVIILNANGGYKPDVTPKEFAAQGAEAEYVRRLAFPSNAKWADVAPYYRAANYAEWVFGGEAAVVNACAYRSPKISNEPENQGVIKRLPSARFNRKWLIETLLPQVNAGQRLIVGKRHGLWNLPSAVKISKGFIADPAPVSPHLSGVVQERIRAFLECV